jgi:hypothetical protein
VGIGATATVVAVNNATTGEASVRITVVEKLFAFVDVPVHVIASSPASIHQLRQDVVGTCFANPMRDAWAQAQEDGIGTAEVQLNPLAYRELGLLARKQDSSVDITVKPRSRA